MNKEKTNRKEKYIIFGILASLALTVILSTSYAVLTKQLTGQKKYTLNVGDLDFTIDNEANAITLTNAYPLTDYEGGNLTPYTFTLTNTGPTRIDYTIKLVGDSSNTLGTDKIKMKLQQGATVEGPRLLSTSDTIYSGTINANESLPFSLRIWLDYDATLEEKEKQYSAHIEVTAIQNISNTYTENILNGADPVLTSDLVPIIIENDGTVKKANINSEWYKYEQKEWANAVVLMDSSVNYNDGEIIPEANIESYFVWIPKYSYKLFNLGNYNSTTSVINAEQVIDVKFGLSNTSGNNKGECTTPMISGESGTCQVGDYMTHPAFISMDTNGLWIGKFETGYKGATNRTQAQSNTIESDKIIIKPNTYSWRNIQVANAFMSTYNYLREADSHMVKNTEWGAVAYLQHSKYGSQTSVRINNNSDYLTGYAATEEPTIGYTGVQCTSTVTENCNIYGTGSDITKPYNTSVGYTASTTGNITGVYDMSGGAHELVMAVTADTNGNPQSGRSKSNNSGFNGNYACPTCDSNTETTMTTGIDFPIAKYYDLYSYMENNYRFSNRILGDASGEVGPFGRKLSGEESRQNSSWYGDEFFYFNVEMPWGTRGERTNFGTGAGLFSFMRDEGDGSANFSFRIVLAP